MTAVSVVIPLYNKEAHIKRAIDSVLSQTFQDLEVIVIDDASTDGGADVVRGYDDPRVRLLGRTEPGPGGYAARNLGVKTSRSEWIAFLDADDEWQTDHIESFMSELSCHPDLKVYGASYRKSLGNGKFVGSSRSRRYGEESPFTILDFDGFLESIIRTEQALWTSATIIRRDVFDVSGDFPDGKTRRGGDTDTWLRVVHAAGAVGWNPKITVTYYMDADNRVMQTPKNYSTSNVITDTCDALIDQVQDARTTELLRKVQAQKYYELAMARKRYSGRMFYSLPETRAYYFLVHPKNVLCLVPDFAFRWVKKIS